MNELLALIAILISFVAMFNYIVSVRRGKTRPHVFSWFIWGSTTFVVFLAQLADGGGVGAWPIGFSGLIALYIALLAFQKRGDLSVTRMDWLCLGAAMTAIPLWALTNNPLWAALILTTIDVIGYLPTLRKGYAAPHEEHLQAFVLMTFRNALSIIALEHYSLTTLVFPVATGLANIVLIGVVTARRRITKK